MQVLKIPREYRPDLAERFDLIAANQDFFGKSVIDIGCANGYFLARLMEVGALSVVGIEPDEQYKGDWIFRTIGDITSSYDICLYLDLHYHDGINYFPWIKSNAKVLFVSASGAGNNKRLEDDLMATFGNYRNLGASTYAHRNLYKVSI